MSAPSLIALAHGSRDHRSAATINALVAQTRELRPDLRIETAFLDHARPRFDKVVAKLVKAGFVEIVVVPLLLTDAFHASVDVPDVIEKAMSDHPGLQILARKVLVVQKSLLNGLEQLR